MTISPVNFFAVIGGITVTLLIAFFVIDLRKAKAEAESEANANKAAMDELRGAVRRFKEDLERARREAGL